MFDMSWRPQTIYPLETHTFPDKFDKWIRAMKAFHPLDLTGKNIMRSTERFLNAEVTCFSNGLHVTSSL